MIISGRNMQHFIALLLLGFACFSPSNSLAGEKPPKAFLAIDGASGQELLSESPDLKIYPASLTKMMTLYLLFDDLSGGRLKLGTRIRFSANAATQPPSKLGIPRGQSITVEKAIYALAVKSANDVAVAVAERLSKSEKNFAARMNRKARAIGMSRTNFVNASGLHNRAQTSTPRDLAMLSRALLYKHKRYFKYFNAQYFRHGRRTVYSHNNFMKRYEGADGIKTGYIRASGFNLAASAVKNGRRLIAVIAGGESGAERDREMMQIMDKGFYLAERLEKPRYAGIAPVSLDFQTGEPAVPPTRDFIAQFLENSSEDKDPSTDYQISEGDTDNDAAPIYASQLGALSSPKAARSLANRRLAELGPVALGGTLKVKPLTLKNGKRLFRARIVGLTDDQAEKACHILKNDGKDCLVIRP